MKRYSLDPLFTAMGMTPNQACIRLGVSGSVQQKYRREGVSERTAELLATRAGYPAAYVWPELIDDRIEDCSQPCVECGTPFLPRRAGHVFCSKPCSWRANKRRRYHADPVTRQKVLDRKKEWTASLSPAARRALSQYSAEWRANNREARREIERRYRSKSKVA